jgi:hypothetical protein
MSLFTSKKRKDAPTPSPVSGERLYSLGPSPAVISALEAFEQARPIAHAIASSHRLFLVLSGADLDESGRAGEWQFHYIFSDEHVEAIITVLTEPHSPLAGAAAISETVTKWPPAGSVQETMLQYQGPAARLIVEQQWNDRLERLPGLPETFVDSTFAMSTFVDSGADIDVQHTGAKLKGRTPPGAYPVWELATGFTVLQTPFSPR